MKRGRTVGAVEEVAISRHHHVRHHGTSGFYILRRQLIDTARRHAASYKDVTCHYAIGLLALWLVMGLGWVRIQDEHHSLAQYTQKSRMRSLTAAQWWWCYGWRQWPGSARIVDSRSEGLQERQIVWMGGYPPGCLSSQSTGQRHLRPGVAGEALGRWILTRRPWVQHAAGR